MLVSDGQLVRRLLVYILVGYNLMNFFLIFCKHLSIQNLIVVYLQRAFTCITD